MPRKKKTEAVEVAETPVDKTPKTIRTRNPEEQTLLRMVRKYQFLMRIRIQVSNGIDAACRMGLIEEHEKDEYIEDAVKGQKKKADAVLKLASKAIKNAPVYTEWLKHVHGIGDNLACQFIAHIAPIGDFPTVSHLWSYAGQRVENGRAVKRERGKKSNWNPELKKLCYQASECFVKASDGFYRTVYDNYKARDRAAHPEKVLRAGAKDRDGKPIYDYTDGHIHMRAKRYAVKMFLSHLWQVWRELEGLETRQPYPIEYLGHQTHISPWRAIENTEEVEAEGELVEV